MNIVGALGAWAAIRREQGRPLSFPGGGPLVTAATDTRLLADAMLDNAGLKDLLSRKW